MSRKPKEECERTKYLRENNLAHCSGCDKDLPQDQFQKSPGTRPFGLKFRCIKCIRIYNSILFKKRWSALSPESRYEIGKKNRLKFFGLDQKDYDELLFEQEGVCAICFQSEMVTDHRTKKIRSLSVDHDHTTGKIRGLLCSKCNQGIGLFNDNVFILKRVIEYLQK